MQNESIFDELLFSRGVVKIGDLISETGNFQSTKILQANLSPVHRFKLMSIVDTIPPDWWLLIKQNQEHSAPQTLNGIIFVRVDGKDVDILNITSKLLCKEFKFKKQTPPTAQKKLQNKYPELAMEWTKIYSLPFIVTIETKLREVQYKLLNDTISTNEKLSRYKMIVHLFAIFVKRKLNPSNFYFLLWVYRSLLAGSYFLT